MKMIPLSNLPLHEIRIGRARFFEALGRHGFAVSARHLDSCPSYRAQSQINEPGPSSWRDETVQLRQQLETLTAERDSLRDELEQLRQQAPTPEPVLPPEIPAGWVSVQLPHVSPAMADLFELIRRLWGAPASPSFTLLQKVVQAELEGIGYNARDAQTIAANIRPDGPSRKKTTPPVNTAGNSRRYAGTSRR